LPALRLSGRSYKVAARLSVWLLLAMGLVLTILATLFPRLPGDLPVAHWVQSLSTPRMDGLMEKVTLLGETYVAVASILVVAAVLALARHRRTAVAFLGIAVLEIMMEALKAIVDRPRPSGELVLVFESGTSGSFPSGHTYHAVVFGGLLLALVVSQIRQPWLRRSVTAIVVALILAVALSRVYLGAHWPSDVLGSVVLGIPSVAFLVFVWRRLPGGANAR